MDKRAWVHGGYYFSVSVSDHLLLPAKLKNCQSYLRLSPRSLPSERGVIWCRILTTIKLEMQSTKQ